MNLLGILGNAARGINPEIDRYREQKDRDQQIEKTQMEQMAERNFVGEFSKGLLGDDLPGAEAAIYKWKGKVKPEAIQQAVTQLQTAKDKKRTQVVDNENNSTIAQAMGQGATRQEGQDLAEAGRAGAGLAGLMEKRRAVEGRAQQARRAEELADIDFQMKSAARDKALGGPDFDAILQKGVDAYKDGNLELAKTYAEQLPEGPKRNSFLAAVSRGTSEGNAKVFTDQSKAVTALLAKQPYIDKFADIERAYGTVNSIFEDLARERAQNGQVVSRGVSRGGRELAALNAFQRLIDPGVAVREGDITLQQNAMSNIEQLALRWKQVGEGSVISPEMMDDMQRAANLLIKNHRENVKRRAEEVFDGIKDVYRKDVIDAARKGLASFGSQQEKQEKMVKIKMPDGREYDVTQEQWERVNGQGQQ